MKPFTPAVKWILWRANRLAEEDDFLRIAHIEQALSEQRNSNAIQTLNPEPARVRRQRAKKRNHGTECIECGEWVSWTTYAAHLHQHSLQPHD